MPRTAVETILVTGFLGAGKTTLLSGWLAARPAGERWAVLVNEFGALGVDRALLGGDGAGGEVAVAEVAGGCACCAAQVAFDATLTRLLRRGPWDRLLVETTGLGHPARLVDRLRAPALAAHVALRPPVAVVDASRAALYLDASRPDHAIAVDQAVLARVLVLNRADALPPGEADALAAALRALPPWPRAVLPTSDGTVALAAVLAAGEAGTMAHGAAATPGGPGAAGEGAVGEFASGGAASPVAGAGPTVTATGGAPASRPAVVATAPDPAATLPEPMRWQRADPAAGAAAAGWWWPAAAAFDRAHLRAALDALAAPDGPLRACGLLRGKGVFRTERAWYGWQWVDGRADWHETAWRADNRLECLARTPIDPQVVDRALRAAASKG
jgi:G3E family GTPase